MRIEGTIHRIPKWPPFKYSFVFIQISLDASFLSLKFKRTFYLERGNKDQLVSA